MDQYPLFMIQLHLQKKQVSHLFHTIFFMIICESPLLFHRREGRGEQSSLACKEICTEKVAVNRAVFDKVKRVLFFTTTETISEDPKESYWWKMVIRCPL